MEYDVPMLTSLEATLKQAAVMMGGVAALGWVSAVLLPRLFGALEWVCRGGEGFGRER